MITLWVATVYLIKTREHKWYTLVTAMPAAFMSAVSLTYILMASEGFGIKKEIAYPIGCVFAVLQFIFYLVMLHRIITSGKYRPDDKNETR